MMNSLFKFSLTLLLALCTLSAQAQTVRKITNIDADWKFSLGDPADAQNPSFNDASWRKLNVPHDWSIEGTPDEEAPSGSGGGFMPTAIGWYRKNLVIPALNPGRESLSSSKALWPTAMSDQRKASGEKAFRIQHL
jgi:beta-galactosidase